MQAAPPYHLPTASHRPKMRHGRRPFSTGRTTCDSPQARKARISRWVMHRSGGGSGPGRPAREGCFPPVGCRCRPPYGESGMGESQLVRSRGLEPPRVLPHSDLNAARLPVPPRPHVWLARGHLASDSANVKRGRAVFSSPSTDRHRGRCPGRDLSEHHPKRGEWGLWTPLPICCKHARQDRGPAVSSGMHEAKHGREARWGSVSR